METAPNSDQPKEPVPQTPISAKDHVLESGAAISQSFDPIKQVCAHLNAFHVYASEPKRCVEANHYCAHLTGDIRQCLIYDSHKADARLIGVEYMITPELYATLPQSERKLWHSHVFEVKSGMLIMPGSNLLPNSAWEVAETKEMEQVIRLYGKTYHFWQVDRGDQVPLGEPVLMTSIPDEDHNSVPNLKQRIAERDAKFGVYHEKKAEKRQYIAEPEVHADADSMWGGT